MAAVRGIRRLNVPVTQILHVAQSLYDGHAPAKRLGFRTAWIQRESRLAATGLAPGVAEQPDFAFSNLARMPDALVC